MSFDAMLNPRKAIASQFSKWHQKWLARHIPAFTQITLNRRNIFILPSSQGFLFLSAILLVFISAINYVLSLAFALAFLMLSIFLLGILYTFKNLQHVHVKALPSEPVFCGEDAIFNVELTRDEGREYEILELSFPKGLRTRSNLIDVMAVREAVLLPTSNRGLVRAPRLRVSTRFPLGLWQAWSNIDLDMHCLVYPKPIAGPMPALASTGGAEGKESHNTGTEDFSGLRGYQPGDSLRQVAWKALAAGQGMKVKQFVDYVDERCVLDWNFYTGIGAEERLSRLCYWVLALSRNNTPFGLSLPGVFLEIDSGDTHRRKALEALAMWQGTGGVQ
ncbi:MAG: DUF58 domain-containing protein [Pseudohongiellaceae bacterium]|nr:DUF58 domain-containing protein [Pseudohongiellaceae bacterium]